MAREPKCRRVEFIPRVTSFKPEGIVLPSQEEVIIKLEELEAIRLKDLHGMEQEECAEHMGVSRPTFQRILIEGRRKIAQGLIEGAAIRIEGGNYCLGQEQCRKQAMKPGHDCLYRDYTGEDAGNQPGTKIAVCAGDNSPKAKVDGRFGRCAYFMLWDDKKGVFVAMINNGPALNKGAGTGAAYELLSQGVGILICNRIGPKAFKIFQDSGVKVYSAGEGMDVTTTLKQYQKGKLAIMHAASNT